MARSINTDRLNYMSVASPVQSVDPLDNLLLGLRRLPVWRRVPITDRESARPALLAYDWYGTPDLYWVPMDYNGLIHHLYFRPGIFIELPEPGRLNDFLAEQSSRLSTLSVSVAASNPFAALRAAGQRPRSITF